MPKETKFYDLLEVPPTASEADIKRSYKKLALKYHPDKNPETAEKFKELSRAYEILSDPDKRQTYDQFGEAGLNGEGGMGGGMSAEELFGSLFGGGLFGHQGGRPGSTGPRKGKDMAHPLKVTLEDLYRGKTSKLALQKNVVCKSCSGRGGKEGAVKTCDGCNGRGVKVTLRQLGPMIQQMQTTCPDCRGEGEVIREKDKCKACNGRKVIQERKVLEVHVDKGMKDGQRIVFNGEADQAPGIVPGDVIIVLQEQEHERFKRRDDDLYYHAKIDLLTALAGGQFAVEHLDKRVLVVTILPGEVIRPGQVKVVSHEGMPSYRHHDNGDLYIQFEIEFPDPKWADDDTIAKLEAILPARKPLPAFAADYLQEEAVLADVDEFKQARQENGNYHDEDDDDDGGPRMQCAQQ